MDTITVAIYDDTMQQLRARNDCVSAKRVGTGFILHHQLSGKGVNHHGIPTIVPCVGSKVPVVIWEVNLNDLLTLEATYGINIYGKSKVDVSCSNIVMECIAFYVLPLYPRASLPRWRRAQLQQYKESIQYNDI